MGQELQLLYGMMAITLFRKLASTTQTAKYGKSTAVVESNYFVHHLVGFRHSPIAVTNKLSWNRCTARVDGLREDMIGSRIGWA